MTTFALAFFLGLFIGANFGLLAFAIVRTLAADTAAEEDCWNELRVKKATGLRWTW